MELLTPSIGTIVWSTIVFVILMLLLAKFAWKPMLKAVNDRENSISDALSLAEKTKAEMAALNAQNETLLKEARIERDQMIKEAGEAGATILAEAKDKATAAADKIVSDAHKAITNDKNAAMAEIKTHVASLSIAIAEKIVKSELTTSENQKKLANQLADEISLN
ncbi:F0F1 ATP synthase subunit B [Putridiphycobacter roseus]|uniref:ATP synthase subunit b n=1 Tax=Putridiphycobacter roseus TaxID=2219161 RepID=A0A2W1NC84_9FLAO|nr:F0F1 ATP synthase subunit B [Putridiphycobacter roseus]PZE16693.1 F0F1 ATP synthase subunit B [Putridiphycobacter roseus]